MNIYTKALKILLITVLICAVFSSCSFGVIRNDKPSKAQSSGGVTSVTVTELQTAGETTTEASTSQSTTLTTTKKAETSEVSSTTATATTAKTTAATTTKATTTKKHNKNDYKDCCFITIETFVLSEGSYVLCGYPIKCQNGDTVYDVLKRACDKNGIDIGEKETGYGKYIYRINGIDEDYLGHKKGGWTYKLNGEMVMKSVDNCNIKEGDKIVFSYVKVD